MAVDVAHVNQSDLAALLVPSAEIGAAEVRAEGGETDQQPYEH
jgi:hypothetical protein